MVLSLLEELRAQGLGMNWRRLVGGVLEADSYGRTPGMGLEIVCSRDRVLWSLVRGKVAAEVLVEAPKIRRSPEPP